MGKVSVEIQKQLKSGAVEVAGGFSGMAMRQPGINALSDGDVIKIPIYDKVLEAPIRGSFVLDEDGKKVLDANGKPKLNTYQFIFAEKADGNAVQFPPSTLWKQRRECDAMGNDGDFVSVSGTVLADLEQFADVEDAMQYLVTATLPTGQNNPNAKNGVPTVGMGKSIKVTMRKIKTKAFGSERIVNANIPTLDWV